jgi:uncharacterized protein
VFISLFEISGETEWLKSAEQLLEYTDDHFYDDAAGLFFFSEKENGMVLTNHFQNEDNVIPAANSVMANNLHASYLLLGKPEYLTRAKKMIHHVSPHFSKYPHAFANWGNLMLKLTEPHYEIVVIGENAPEKFLVMQNSFHPNVIWAYSERNSNLPLFKGRFVSGKTLIYVCREGACQLPVESAAEALKMLE